MHPNKNRSRSVQLDQVTASATAASTPTSPSPAITNRSSSLALHRDENARPNFRSMLDVEPASKIAPFKALDLEDLHGRREVMPLTACQPP